MKIIEKLSNMLEEEMKDSEKYIECAMKYKEKGDLILSKTFYDLSIDEMKHASLLHDNIARLITEYRNTGETVPEKMQAVYDYLHEKHIEKANEIRLHQNMFRG